ncbi:hypothetical protein PAMP_018974 [Pampus punctatissimus]
MCTSVCVCVCVCAFAHRWVCARPMPQVAVFAQWSVCRYTCSPLREALSVASWQSRAGTENWTDWISGGTSGRAEDMAEVGSFQLPLIRPPTASCNFCTSCFSGFGYDVWSRGERSGVPGVLELALAGPAAPLPLSLLLLIWHGFTVLSLGWVRLSGRRRWRKIRERGGGGGDRNTNRTRDG